MWTQYTYLDSSQNSSSEKGSDEFMQIFKIRLNSSFFTLATEKLRKKWFGSYNQAAVSGTQEVLRKH